MRLATQPASSEAARADGLRREQGVVEAAQAQAHHQHHRQGQRLREIGAGLLSDSGT